MANKIIHWNCRGIKANYNELLLLISDLCPEIICLQETFLKSSDNLTFRNFTEYSMFTNNPNRASGGSTILANNRIPQSKLNLKTNLQAVAISATLHKTVTICSIYIPPNDQIDVKEFENLIEQLPKPFLLLGDFNSHNSIWGSIHTDRKGSSLEKVIHDNSLCLYNDGKSTYLHPASGTYSAIDLSLCDPSIYLDYSWSVHDDTCGSDHFPVILEHSGPDITSKVPRWNLNKADWGTFRMLCEERLTPDDNNIDQMTRFTKTLISIAEECIPKKSTSTKYNRPWFNDDCKKSIRQRRAALRKFNIHPTKENLDKFRACRAKARHTIKDSKRNSWRSFVSKLNSKTKCKTVWNMIRKISGKNVNGPLKHLKKNGDKICNKKDIADLLADTFASNSSTQNYGKEFQKIKRNSEKTQLKFQSDNMEEYNKTFSIQELKDSLKRSHNTAEGPDEVNYEFIKQLPDASLLYLLQIFNEIWTSGNVPELWRIATIIPIPKPGKDSSDPSNYRPIALTSCLCKTFERMVNNRLVWFLETNNLITDFQCGFRNKRGTIDHLVRLESFIRDAFIKKEHLTAVFFDLEKAYDTTWKYGIMKDLKDLGLMGRLPIFINNFLNDRHFKVRVGASHSHLQEQEMGVPQGSILSVTLFSVKINNIVKCLNPGVDCSLYVDDFLICYRSKHIHTIERQLQQCLNKLHKWATENGFKFSRTKTKCMHFCQMRKVHADPILYLDGTEIPVVDEYKFLGLIFDKKLTFIPHIKYLKDRCTKALQLIRVVAHTDWGADRQVLLRLYRSLIRSKLDYGCFIYGSARESYIKSLDTIHHQGLRLVLGAFRTSPAESLYAEAHEAPLALRRQKLAMQYFVKLSSCPNNPAYNCIFNPYYKPLFDQKERVIKPFGLRIGSLVSDTSIDLDHVHESTFPKITPWTIRQPIVIFLLSDLQKSNTDPNLYMERFRCVRENFVGYENIYTDGSKSGFKCGCSAVLNDRTFKRRLPDNSSIFSGEATAIDLALDLIIESDANHFIIFSDSLSVLTSLHNRNLNNPLIVNLLERITEISHTKSIVFCWIPSHIGIRGNEKADMAAKESLLQEIHNMKVPYTDYKHVINKFIMNKWQERWDALQLSNKLCLIKPKLGEWHPGFRQNRKEEVVLSRIRIGHAYFSHSFLLRGEDRPECIGCQAPYSVRHILLECADFIQARERLYTVQSLKDLFDSVSVQNIILFLKEINLFNKV